VISERIDQALRTIQARNFHAHHEGESCVLQLHHEGGVRILARDGGGVDDGDGDKHHRASPTPQYAHSPPQYNPYLARDASTATTLVGHHKADRDAAAAVRVVFVCPYPALAAVRPFPESSTLEFELKSGTHHNKIFRVQIDDLEEAIFFLLGFMEAYARSHGHVQSLK
jgi:hypothetical protein